MGTQPVAITPAEYAQRRDRLRDRCGENGLDGIVVWSKGGHSDSAGDVFYLANYHPRFNRSQAALVVPVHGEPTLVVDVLDVRRDLIAVDRVEFAYDVPGKVAQLLDEINPAGQFGLVRGAALTAVADTELRAAAPEQRFAAMDEAVQDLRVVKSPAEIELIRRAAAIGTGAFAAMMDVAQRPGQTEGAAVAAAYNYGVPQGMVPIDAMVASGPASEYFAFGQSARWSPRVLEAGDLFHVDHAAYVEGYMFDVARTCVTGGRATQAQRELLDGAIAAVRTGIAFVRPGVTGAELYTVVEDALREQGISTPQSPLMGHGHGIGIGFEWPFVLPFEQREIRAGMVLSVETMAGRAGVGSVYFEQNVLVGTDGVELLSTAPEEFW